MKLVAANLKANHTPNSTQSYLKKLETTLQALSPKGVEVIVFPNMASLSPNVFRHFQIGAQNLYPARNGAFTGEIGLDVLDSLGINQVLLGHSERRQILGEEDGFILKKLEFCQEAGKKIMLCIGEATDLESKKLEGFLAGQLRGVNLDYPGLSLAYEPVWAIGSGKVASRNHIEKVMKTLRSFGAKVCLYGGSVNSDSAKDIGEITDGILVGSASLEASVFSRLVMQIAG